MACCFQSILPHLLYSLKGEIERFLKRLLLRTCRVGSFRKLFVLHFISSPQTPLLLDTFLVGLLKLVANSLSGMENLHLTIR